MPSAESRSSGGSGDYRGRSRGRDNAVIITYDSMTALNSVHPDLLTRMTDIELNDAITAVVTACRRMTASTRRRPYNAGCS